MATSVVNPRVQFFANNGRPLIGGRIHTYVAGSSTRAPTYKDSARAQPNTNPIILDGRGEASIYLDIGVEYKFIVEDSKGALLLTQEPVYGAIWPDAANWPSDATLAYQYMLEAKAAAGAIGPLKFYSTYAQALADIANVPLDGLVEVSVDETKDGARTRYFKRTGNVFEFSVNLDQIRLDLATAGGSQRIGLPPTAIVASIQAAFDSDETHKVTLQPGIYPIDGATLRIFNKNQNTRRGEYVVDLTGVEFQGSGTIIIDSCKRLEIRGLYAPGWDIEFRGAWWIDIVGCMYRNQIQGRAGTIFSNNYWNNFIKTVNQAIVVPSDAVGVNNSFEWVNATLRGDAQQGFLSTAPYAFDFSGNVNCQHWRFSGDISYHTQAVYTVGVGNISGDVELDMNGYCDTLIPLAYNRAGVKIIANGHHANGAGLNLSHEAATRNAYRLERSDRSLIHNCASGVNQVINGDLSVIAPAGHALMPVTTGGTVSADFVTENSAASRAILNVTRSDSGTVFFKTLAAMTTGRYTGRWVVRLPNGQAARDVQFRVGSRYFTTSVTSTQWHVVTLTEETPIVAGQQPAISFNSSDGAAITLRFAYVGLTYGAGGAMYERSVQPQTLIGELVAAIPTTAANATTSITVPCQGAAIGDFVQWSCSAGVGAWLVSANIAAANEVRIYLRNTGGSDQSIVSATWRVKVTKAGT